MRKTVNGETRTLGPAKFWRKFANWALALSCLFALVLSGCSGTGAGNTATTSESGTTTSKLSGEYSTISDSEKSGKVVKGNAYSTKEEVALYIHSYGELPSNFITKKEAQALGWDGGSLEPYAPGKSIGGDYFGNYEGNLPKKKGRTYHECDIDTTGKRSRGAKRIVYSNDGLIYYTGNHYETFTLLYGEE